MSETMKRAHELAPFVAEALRAVAEEADSPDGKDSREWTEAEHAAHQFAVDIAFGLITGDAGGILEDSISTYAKAARDAALEEYHG